MRTVPNCVHSLPHSIDCSLPEFPRGPRAAPGRVVDRFAPGGRIILRLRYAPRDEAATNPGTVSSYAEVAKDGVPKAIGGVWSADALDMLPKDSDHHGCFGRTPDGAIDAATKCQHAHEFVIPLPDAVAHRDDVPHFDVHFEMEPIADVFAIEPGPCGPEFVRCEQFQTARKSLPPELPGAGLRRCGGGRPGDG